MAQWLNKPPLGVPLIPDHPQIPKVVWYTFQGGAGGIVPNIVDPTGDTNGELNGFDNPATVTSGWRGKVLQFDDVDDFVDAGSQIIDAGAFSVMCWIKPDSISVNQRIISQAGNDPGDILITINDNDGHIGFLRWTGVLITNFDKWVSTGTVDTNWHHVACIWDGVTGHIAIDGIMESPANVPASSTSDTESFHIGEGGVVGANYFGGMIDDVRVDNRAWMEAEIQDVVHNPWAAFWKPSPASIFVLSVGALFTETPSDSFIITESPVLDISKIKADSLIITEATALDISKVKADSLTITEATAKSVQLVRSDSFTITESTALSIAKEVGDALSISESAVNAIQIVVSDSITITEADAVEIQKSISDNITTTESTSKVIQKAISDSVVISDVVANVLQIIAADGITVTDSAVTGLGGIITEAVADAITISDSAVAVKITGAALKTRKEPIDREAETIEWHEIIDIERGVE